MRSPVDVHERIGRDQLAGLAIQNIEKAVTVGVHQRGHGPAFDPEIVENRLINAVVIPDIVRRKLITPLDRARIRVERELGCGPQIGVRANIDGIVTARLAAPRSAVTGGPVNEVQLWIVGPYAPGRTGTGLPGITQPCLVARLALTRNGVGLPDLIARILIVGSDETANTVLATGDSGYDEILVDEWRRGDGVTCLVVLNRDGPELLAGPGVKRHQFRIETTEEYLAIRVCNAAVIQAATNGSEIVIRHFGLMYPLGLAGSRIERKHIPRTGRRRDIHRVADNQRGRLLGLESTQRVHPRDLQFVDVTGIDLFEIAEAGV